MINKTRSILLGAAIAIPLSLNAAPKAQDAKAPKVKPPNIVLLLADDLGYGDLSCYGATRISTPNIDRLASQGLKFTDAHAPAAVCQPTRYGIMTGRYYWRAPRTEPALYFKEGEILMPQVFKEHGYNTAAFGKWHLGWGSGEPLNEKFWNGEIKPGPLECGFDYYFGVPQSHSQPPFVFVENHHIYKGDPKDPLILTQTQPAHWKYTGNSGGSTGAKAAHAACDYDRLDLTLAQKVSQYIAQQSAAKPFFVYVPFYAPHVPLLPAKEFRGTSGAGEYGDFIQQLDSAVGTVLKALEEQGLADNTLVVVTSDNGGCYIHEAMDLGHRANGKLLGLKADTWEGGHRIPMIVRWPGRVPAGAECDKLFSLTDLFPTFASAAGILLPRNAAPDGLNQAPMLEHPAGTPAIRNEMVYTGRGSALRSGDWVYQPEKGSQGLFGTFYFKQLGYRNSEYDEDGNLLPTALPEQLYNLREDPTQTKNLLREQPEVAVQMAERFKEIMRQRKSR